VDGLVLRPYSGREDVPAIVEIINAEWEHDRLPSRVTVAEKTAEYAHASDKFDARRDLTIAEFDGRAIGYGVRGWYDAADSDLRQYRVDGSVHPAWRRRGIGRALLLENMCLAEQLAASHQTLRGRAFGSQSHEHQAGDETLLRGAGFVPARHFFDMLRPTLDEVPDLPLPAGLEIRSANAGDARAVWLADVEAFRDHWGGYDDSDESFQRFVDAPEFDPDMWVVAWADDEVAGGVVNGIYAEENAWLGVRHGWLDSVFTRRPWRRRGLARALIARSLVLLRERGMTGAMLGVDAANATGALGLYESVGFHVEHRSTAWRKPFEVRP
jgi:mycothiol synthase